MLVSGSISFTHDFGLGELLSITYVTGGVCSFSKEVVMSFFIMSCPSTTGFLTGHAWSFFEISIGLGSLSHLKELGLFGLFLLC